MTFIVNVLLVCIFLFASTVRVGRFIILITGIIFTLARFSSETPYSFTSKKLQACLKKFFVSCSSLTELLELGV